MSATSGKGNAQIDRRDLLARLPIFSTLSERDLDHLVGLTTTKRLAPREELCHKGDEGAQLYGVMTGRLKAVGTSLDGKEIVFSFIDPGETVGEIALLDEGMRSATVVAVESSELFALHRRELFGFLERNPKAAIKLAQGVAAHVRRLSESVEDTVFLGLPSRLAKKLLALAESYGKQTGNGVEIEMNLPQQALGELVGTTRESINKQLKLWAEQALVNFERGRVTLLDREQLELIADELDD